jgi:DNA polymerase-1
MLKCEWTHTTITSEEALNNMVSNYKASDVLVAAFDTETTGLHHIYDKPFLFQFGWCTSDYKGYTYAVDIEAYPDLAQRVITVWNVLASTAPKYIGHNVKFDLHMLLNIDIPYWYNNISDTMIWIRLGSDAVPERKGGSPLALKAFAARYITPEAKNMESKLKEERTQISKALNMKLKTRLCWTKKQIDEFFGDKLNTAEDLPESKRNAYKLWYENDLPDYLKGKITGAVSSDDIPYNKLNRENVIYYGHLDIVWTIEAFLILKPIVTLRDNLDAIRREEENIYPLVRMERVGFKIDYEYLLNAHNALKEYTRQRRQDLCQIAGTEVKATQSAKILQLLNEFGVNVTTTNAEEIGRTLSDLKHTQPDNPAIDFIETLQELRTLEKWYSTYIMRFLQDFREEDGKLYTTINQAGTVSGRVTSDFQQFPKDGIKTIDGREIFHPRRMVVAQDGDFDAIVYLDYSQIELRLQAFYTIVIGHPDTNLCRAYSPYKCHLDDGTPYDVHNPWCIEHAYDLVWRYDENPTEKWTPLDVHGATTKIAFGIDESHPDFHTLRYKGKRVNFAKNYGAQFSKIKEMFPEYDDEQVHKIDDAYYLAFPGVKEYHNYCYQIANQKAYMQNMFGVKYYGASGHNLINMLVQGTGAYYLKWKIVQVDKYLREHNCKSQLMMQIHDELQFKKHKDDDPKIFFEIKKIMETWDETLIPIIADMEVTQTTWADKYEVESLEDFYGKDV